MNRIRVYKIKMTLPYFTRGTEFVFYDSTAEVYWIDNGKMTEHPLRPELSGYLWMLISERAVMELIRTENED